MDIPLIFAAAAGMGGLSVLGITAMKLAMQHQQENYRKHYVINFPRDLPFDCVLGFVRSLGGVKGAVVFEASATDKGIEHRLTVPTKLADYVIGQLRGQIPGVHVTVAELDVSEWDEATELVMTSGRVPLRIPSPGSVISTMLSSLVPLKSGERLMMQWVITPSFPHPPGDDKALKEKQREHNFSGVLRVGSNADRVDTGRKLIRRVYMGLGSVRAYGVRFRPGRLPSSMVKDRLNRRAVPIGYSSNLNATELATLIAFPAGDLSIPGLPQSQSKNLAADLAIPSEGIVIGVSNYPGDERPLAIAPLDLLRHMWVAGPTGTGKSTALHNMAAQIMEQGYGLMLLEPKGDLVDDVLNSVPANRRDDVIVFDPSDSEYPVGLNILTDTDPERITGHIVGLFKGIYSESWGPRLEQILRYAVLTAALNGLSLYDVKQLLVSPSFRRGVVRRLKNPDVKEFWSRYERIADSAADSVVNKLDAFLGYSVIRNIVGQPKSGFDMAQVLNESKILLVPVQSGLVGDANAAMLGSLIVSLAWQGARARAALPRADRKPFFMVIDEFQNYLNLPVAIGDALAQARGYGLGLVLANQHLAQLKPEVKSAVMANARSKVVFQTTADDARVLTAEFAPHVATHDLQNLGKYEAVLKLMANDQIVPPATAHLPGPPRPTGSGHAVRNASRAAYARPVAQVEAEFLDRYKSLSEPVQRPSVGRETDD